MTALLHRSPSSRRLAAAREVTKAGVAHRALRVIAAPFLSLFLACSGAGTDVVPIASFSIATTTTTVPIGDVRQLDAKALDAGGNVVDGRVVTWSSSNINLAAVSSTGRVSTKAPGTVTITATSDGWSDTVALKVVTFSGGVQNIYPGNLYTCALNQRGRASCWGNNEFGNLGDGTHKNTLSPVLVSQAPNFSTLALGDRFACGLSVGGAAFCWGYNEAGQLGDATTTERPKAAPVVGGYVFTAIAAGASHVCGLSGGAAYCWGHNYYGALGDGTTADSPSPVPVQGGLSFTSITAAIDYSCGLATDGKAYCWGKNFNGELGSGTTTDRNIPTLAAGGGTFRSISSSDKHTCGLTAVGAIRCWGGNIDTPPSGDRVFASISVGGLSSCLLDSDGLAFCWGHGDAGVLGQGASTGDSKAPIAVHGGLVFSQVVAGTSQNCGVTAIGAAYCWGMGGLIGDGTSTMRALPTLVAVP